MRKVAMFVFILISIQSAAQAFDKLPDGLYALAEGDQYILISGETAKMLRSGLLREGDKCTTSDSELKYSDTGTITATFNLACTNKGSEEITITISMSEGPIAYRECVRGTTPTRYDNCMIQFGGVITKVPDSTSIPQEPQHVNIYCRDFHPGGRYLTKVVDSNEPQAEVPGRHTNAQINEALIQTFIEQLGFILFSEDDNRLRNSIKSTLESNVTVALGVDPEGGLIQPYDWKTQGIAIKVRVLPTAEVSAFSTTPNNIFLTSGLVRRIVLIAAEKNFGSVDNYKKHLLTISTNGVKYPVPDSNIWNGAEWVKAYNSDRPSEIPIGSLMYYWKSQSSRSSSDANAESAFLGNIEQFAIDVSSALFFIGTHEIGHLKKHHHERQVKSCKQFEDIEIEADSYAARQLASFVFGMLPWSEGKSGDILNLGSFFEIYSSAGFTGRALVGNCAYPSIYNRTRNFDAEFSTEYTRITRLTMTSTRYDKPLGGSSCSHVRDVVRGLD